MRVHPRSRRGELRAGHPGDPRNADQAFLDSDPDEIPRRESIEITAVDGKTLETAPRAPGGDNEAATRNGPWHCELFDHARFFKPWRRAIERPIGEQKDREKPRNRNEPVVDAFESLDLRVPQCASLDPHGYAERQKKEDTDEDHDRVK